MNDAPPLASLNTRMAQYRARKKDFWQKEFPVKALIFATIAALLYFGLGFVFPESELPGHYESLGKERVIYFFMFAYVLILIPTLLTYSINNRKPTPDDVKLDKALRRIAGMDHRTDEEVD
jgi:hypothetical protein